MIVTAVLVSHDGARWLPAVIDGIRTQDHPVDRVVAIDTGSKDASVRLLSEAFGDAAVHVVSGATTWPQAVDLALDAARRDGDDELVWLLHDDANPAPGALAALLDVARARPDVSILGPKLREWPSLRRLLELGVTISGTGRRETGLERGEYDQGQHDEVRSTLAVNTAGMLVRRSVLEELGGFDADLPIFGNDIDFGWRAAQAGHTTVVVPQAVVFHAEAAHRGVRRTPLTGRHTHYQERRAALFTLLANAPARRLPWQVVRLFLGTLLRVLGFLAVRSVGEALDELAALVSIYSRPRHLLAARRGRVERRTGQPADVRGLLAPPWVPYRHGLDLVSDLASALTSQAQDVAERRRAASLAAAGPVATPTRGTGRPAEGRHGHVDDEDDELLADTGFVARFLTNPVALTLMLVVVLSLVAARVAFGSVVGGGLAPVPASVSDWWHLHLEAWHPLGTGTDVPAPAYLLPFALVGAVIGGPGAVVSTLMLLAVPFALWGAWRLLRVVGRLVDARGVPRWLLVWGSVTYALVPATSGAWGEGRFGTVAVTALMPWLAHAALGFVDPEPDRRWRAAWRTGLLLALSTAFVPEVWLFGVLAAVIVVAAGFAIAPRLLRDRSAWGPPAVALGIVPVLLAPWLIPLVYTGSAAGLLLEAGRLPVASVERLDLLTGRMGDLGAPWWLGAVIGLLAVLALVPRATRVPVLVCWVVALAAALVAAALGHVSLSLPATTTSPSLGFLVVVLQGLAVVAAVLGAEAWLRRLQDHHPVWQRALAGALAFVAALVPLGGLAWWLTESPHDLAQDTEAVVPAYMEQSSLTGDEHGVLVVRGSVDQGLTYRVRRGDGVTMGEDEILALADEDAGFSADVTELVSRPTATSVAALADAGIEYVVMPTPADGRVAAALDATTGLVQASAEDRETRAWRVDRALDPDAVDGPGSVVRILLLVVQALAVVVVAVLAGPTVRRREP